MGQATWAGSLLPARWVGHHRQHDHRGQRVSYWREEPTVLCDDEARPVVERAGLEAMVWGDFLLRGPCPGTPVPR